MKPFIPYSLLAAAALCGAAFGQTATTTPVGYVTHTLAPNMFNLVGVTLHSPTVASGVIDAESATSVTDNEVNFGTTLEAGSTYILELGDGTIQEITSWSGSALTTPNDITGLVTPGTTTYKVRRAQTVSDIFGENNTFGLTPSADGESGSADKILILNASNSFDTVFYFNDGAGIEGWLDSEGELAGDKVIAYPDGFFVQRVAGAPISLVVSGEVKTAPTGGVLVNGFNYLSAVAPVGLTLDSSSLKNYITASTDGDSTSADNVLIQNPGGTYTTAFYFNDGAGVEGWLDSEGELAGDLPLDSGFLILNRGGVKPYNVAIPASYSSL
jgi:hypothetical protein